MTSSESALRRLLTARRAEVATVSVAAKPATVFDSQDVTAPYTQYMFKLRSSGASKEEWRFRKRYSEFRALRRKLRRWRKRWEMSCAKQGEAFQAVAKLLKQAAGPDFPRKHIRNPAVPGDSAEAEGGRGQVDPSGHGSAGRGGDEDPRRGRSDAAVLHLPRRERPD
ncbi:hypothetical protein ON010_g13484 [Phytophthora cinnamomi]|nr:hypothetical protein ON010_g13484 [Phytophthora cinnamomi]